MDMGRTQFTAYITQLYGQMQTHAENNMADLSSDEAALFHSATTVIGMLHKRLTRAHAPLTKPKESNHE